MTSDIGEQVEARLNEIMMAHSDVAKAIGLGLQASQENFMAFLGGKLLLLIISKPSNGGIFYAKPVENLIEKFTQE
jgi:hypothetical protein